MAKSEDLHVGQEVILHMEGGGCDNKPVVVLEIGPADARFPLAYVEDEHGDCTWEHVSDLEIPTITALVTTTQLTAPVISERIIAAIRDLKEVETDAEDAMARAHISYAISNLRTALGHLVEVK